MYVYTHDDEDESGEDGVEKLKPVLEKVKKAVEKFDNLMDKCSL